MAPRRLGCSLLRRHAALLEIAAHVVYAAEERPQQLPPIASPSSRSPICVLAKKYVSPSMVRCAGDKEPRFAERRETGCRGGRSKSSGIDGRVGRMVYNKYENKPSDARVLSCETCRILVKCIWNPQTQNNRAPKPLNSSLRPIRPSHPRLQLWWLMPFSQILLLLALLLHRSKIQNSMPRHSQDWDHNDFVRSLNESVLFPASSKPLVVSQEAQVDAFLAGGSQASHYLLSIFRPPCPDGFRTAESRSPLSYPGGSGSLI